MTFGRGDSVLALMSLTRREFIGAAAAGGALGGARLAARSTPHIKAVAFDAFAVFDPAAVTDAATALFPVAGVRLVEAWRRRQFEYSWLRVVANRYVDFWQVTREALVFAAMTSGIELKASDVEHLMNAHVRLNAWPEAAAVMAALRRSGVRLALLSNFTARMLEDNVRRAGLYGVFEHSIATDRARTYKPAPGAYRLGVEAFRLAPAEILFVASAGWDAAGARMFGYPTFWVNRGAAPPEQLGVEADASAASLLPLPAFVG